MSRIDYEAVRVARVLDWIYEQPLETVKAWQASGTSVHDAQQEYHKQRVAWLLDFTKLYFEAMLEYSQETHRARLREKAEFDLFHAKKRLEELE